MRNSWHGLAVVLLVSGACSRPAAHSETSVRANAKSTGSQARAFAATRQAPAPLDVAAPPVDAELTPSGVASKLLRPGQGGEAAQPNDCVRVRYTSWKRDGTLHASSADGAQPTTQCLRRAMPGLAEAALRMTVGEERRIWVPGKLTYRSNDADQPAPADDLTFDLELLEVLRAPPVPKDLRAPPAGARKTASGLALRVLEKGVGVRKAHPNERMTVRFTGWTEDGVLFESTELGGTGRPASVSRADVARGVGEALSLLQVGEKARVWVPAALAFGDKPRRGFPNGNLIYDLELLAIE